MKNNRWKQFGLIVLVLAFILGMWLRPGRDSKAETVQQTVHPVVGDIQLSVSTTGTVLPKNRLEVKPPVNGRIEQLLVKEGQTVKVGETMGWMSSTERAALLDAARGQGEEKLKYWQDVYKAIPIMAPIAGEVIVATTQPGQTVTTTDAVVVLSDQLIVRAQVDETDIGKVKIGQHATLTLDAYPETNINAVVDHIYYESQTVNNVTVYKVDLVPETVPAFFRSGMNANINIAQDSRRGVLLLPMAAVEQNKGKAFVWLVSGEDSKPQRQQIQLGLSDDKNVEVVGGLTIDDAVVTKAQKYVLPKKSGGTNPFMPARKR